METSGSPQGGPKRACEASATEARESRDGSNAAGASGNQPLTLALLQQALQVNQQQITSCLQESLSGLGNRVGRVEQQLDEHVQRSTDLFDVMTTRHCSMENTVNNMRRTWQILMRRLRNASSSWKESSPVPLFQQRVHVLPKAGDLTVAADQPL